MISTSTSDIFCKCLKMGSSSNEELCLKWNDFESVLSHSFNTMRNELDFCDVKIACFDDKSNMKTIPAHKVVLSGKVSRGGRRC